MKEESAFGKKSITSFVVVSLLAAILLNQAISLVFSILDNDFTKGVMTSAIAIFLGNFFLQQNERRREEEKAISGIVLNVSRIAKKLKRAGDNFVTTQNLLQMQSGGTLNKERRSIISKLCYEVLEHAQEIQTLTKDI